MCDKISDPAKKAQIESVSFIKRIPVGFYQFRYPVSHNDESADEKICDILVYENLRDAYSTMINDIPSLFGSARNSYDNPEAIDYDDLYKFSNYCEDKYFSETERYPAYRIEDIDDLLRFFFITGETPKFFSFDERDKFDIDKIAREILDQDMGRRTMESFLEQKWEAEKDSWEAFFNYKPHIFREEVFHAIERILHPEEHRQAGYHPDLSYEQRKFEDMSLEAIRSIDPEYHSWLKNKVFERYMDEDGYYHSASGDYASKQRSNFEIDHIKPMSKGGKTTLDNLQLLTWRENRKKGANWEPPVDEACDDVEVKKTSEGRLSVVHHDLTKIQRESNQATFIAAILYYGIEKTASLGLRHRRQPLLVKEWRQGYSRCEFDGYYILDGLDACEMKQILDEMSDRAGFLWHVNIDNK